MIARVAGVGGEQVEGRRAVRELLAAGRRPVREIWIAEGRDQADILTDILELASEHRVEVHKVSRGRLDAAARTDAPQGVIGFAAPLPEARLEALARPSPGEAVPFLLVLDGVTDAHNVGALLRTAESAGATGAIVPRHRAAHVTPAVAKSAAGAIEHLPIAVVGGIAAALRSLADFGVWTIGLDADAPTALWDAEVAKLLTGPVALVLGAEGRGLSRLVRDRCDLLVAIPGRGVTASLNVAAAGAIACFEVVHRRG